MSFLNSLLSTAGGGQPLAAPTSKPQTSERRPKPAQPPKTTTAGNVNGIGGSMGAPKRKAESDLNDIPPKTQRKDGPAAKSQTNQPARLGGASSSPPIKPQPSSPAAPAAPTPYRGTARPSSGPNSRPTTPSTTTKPAPKTAGPSTAPPTNASRSGSAPAQAPATSAPPKKATGYAAILERARAAQQTQQPVGSIKHKAAEKLTRKERLALEAEAKNRNMTSKMQKMGINGQHRPAGPSAAKPEDTGKEKRKPLELAYKGTMRPAAPAYTGTMKPSGSSRKPANAPKDKGARYAAYASYSEEDLDEEDEEEAGYGSDGSSDMEATGLDLEEEEQMSLKVAKKEDMEALKQESELKRQKEERRRRLAEMADAAAAKKKRY